MASPDEPTAEERAILLIVTQLRAAGDIEPLITVIQDGRDGPERARDTLAVLAELDPELLVQVALDALIHVHADDPHAARQTRMVVRNST